jgi:hypothetical protein
MALPLIPSGSDRVEMYEFAVTFQVLVASSVNLISFAELVGLMALF